MNLVDSNGTEVVPIFPHFFDSNLIADAKGCEHIFYYRHILGLRAKGPAGWHLHFGHCFAKSLEVFRQAFYAEQVGFKEAQARGFEALTRAWGRDHPLVAPDDAPDSIRKKTYYACLDAFKSYLIKYPPDVDHITPLIINGKAAVEFTFGIPIPGCFHPVDGQPLIYCGRFDMLGKYGNAVFVLDDKTTSALGPTWPDQWRMRAQLTGYVWAAKTYKYPVGGAAVRGNAILVKDITHAEVIEQRNQMEIDRWMREVQRTIRRLIWAWENDDWEYNLNESCAKFGGCSFLRLDKVNNPAPWIAQDYVVDRWDPMAENED